MKWVSRVGLSSTVTFKVTNKGSIYHRFKVCAAPVTSAKLTSCKGSVTKFLDPGQSGTLTVTFKKNGTYEFLSDVPEQAAYGMKGPSTIPSTGSASTGAALFTSLDCATCHSLSAVKAAGTVTPSINTTHSGGGFPNGPLTSDQISALAAYVNG